MEYTEDDLIDLIARHDEHEAFYRQKLDELRTEPAPSRPCAPRGDENGAGGA